ncbi:MAG: Uma2 family endonuclease, partial [Spirochaetales bacterium]|nr:Uma2 family endonuclease [Spirochaetales bacterium]
MAIPKETYKDHFTYAEYKDWGEEERWELIEGEAFSMSPAPGTNHQAVSGEIFRQIANFLESNPCQVFSAPFDVFLPEEDESSNKTSTIVQPDITVIFDKSKLREKGFTGAPDIIIEILSPSSASRDQIKKLYLYEKKGVKEYWIVHPIDKILWKYILADQQYGKPQIFDYKGTP